MIKNAGSTTDQGWTNDKKWDVGHYNKVVRMGYIRLIGGHFFRQGEAIVNDQYQWLQPFNNQFGDGMVHRQFTIGSTLYAVGFEEIETMGDFIRKGIDILRVNPVFRFPNNGVWGVIFDKIDPLTMDFKGFQHIQHSGVMGGRRLYNVASIILEHYIVCNAGAYVFSAAPDPLQLRGSDLVDIYSRALGVDGHEKSKLFSTLFAGWQAFSDVVTGGRGYVVTTESY